MAARLPVTRLYTRTISAKNQQQVDQTTGNVKAKPSEPEHKQDDEQRP